MRNTYLGLIMAATLLVPTALAAHQADGSSETPSVRVSFADLDLSSHAGQAAFDRRIARAIDGMCGTADSGNLDLAAPVWKCRSAANRSASSQRELALAAARQHSNMQLAIRGR
jgi:UrcA family protein